MSPPESADLQAIETEGHEGHSYVPDDDLLQAELDRYRQKVTDGRHRRPLIGDPMYPVYLADKVKEGHLTHEEAQQQYAHHRVIETFCEESGRGA